MATRYAFPLPSRTEPVDIAKRLANKPGLELAILQALIGRPKRYTELKPLLGGRRDHNLTRALRRLRNEGVLRQRSDVSQDPPVDSYELSDLGVRVVMALMERAALERIAQLAHGDPRRLAAAFRA
jgi:DNA-binding HxlR family transcriptional regulator